MALATNGTPGEIILNGDLHGSSDPYAPELTPTGVVPGTYNLPNVVVDAKGRILYAEDFSTDDVPYATASVYGIGSICHHLTIDVSNCVNVNTASTTQYGMVQVGANLVINAGVLDLDWSGVPIATTNSLGFVKVPANGGISVDGAGNISICVADTVCAGVIRVPGGDGLAIDGAGVLTFTDPKATTTTIGSVIVPTSGNIDVDGSGNISVPVATTSTVGVIKIPAADPYLAIDGAGELTNTYVYTPTAATTIALGDVIVPTSGNIDVDGAGNISIPDATSGAKGVIQVGSNIDVAAGVISVPIATNSTLGEIIVPTADGLSIDGSGFINYSSTTSDPATISTIGAVIVPVSGNINVDGFGNISIPDATSGSKGVVQGGNYNTITAGVLDVDKATNSTLGVVIVPTADGLSVDANGAVNYSSTTSDPATISTLGQVIVPTSGNMTVDGSGNIDVPLSTPSVFGLVKGGNHILFTSPGVISVDPASYATTYGVVKSADTNNITISAGDINVGSNVTKLDTDHIFTKTQSGGLTTLTPAASVTPNGSTAQFFKLTLDQTTTLNVPSTPITGTTYHIIVNLNGHSLTLASGYKTSSTATATPIGITVISCYYDGTNFQTIIQPDFQ